METYVRRDIAFVMSKIYGKKGDKDKGEFGFTVDQSEIEEWVREQYEKKDKREQDEHV